TAHIDHGQRIRVLRLEGSGLDGGIEGEWQRREGRSSATLKFDVSSKDPPGVLRAAGYTPNLDAKRAHVKGTLAWDPAPQGLDWRRARGAVNLEFQDGQLRAVEPGAGRVLGLLNFYALPRRLTLNFRDIWSKGLG